MKIVINHYATDATAAVHLEGIASGLRQAGHNVREVGPPAVVRLQVRSSKQRLGASVRSTVRLAYNLPAVAILLAAVLRTRPDFIWERYAPFGVAGVIVSKLLHIPVLLEVDSLFAHNEPEIVGGRFVRLARAIELAIIRNVDCVCPVSSVLSNSIHRMGARRVEMIANAAHPMPVENREAARQLFGMSGTAVGILQNFDLYAGSADTIDLYATYVRLFHASGAQIYVAGEGAGLERLRSSSGASVALLGRLDRQSVARFVTACDVGLVVHTQPWTSPLKAYEFLAGGALVVGPEHPALTELSRATDSVRVLRPDAEQVSNVVSMVADPEQRQKLRDSALQFASDNRWLDRGIQASRIIRPIHAGEPEDRSMRSSVKRLAARALTSPLRPLLDNGPAIFAFHSVGTGSPWSLPPRQFADIIKALAAEANVIGLDDLGTSALPSCSITFDDGYADVAENALPLLEGLGLTATLFVSTALLDGDDGVRERLGEYQRLPSLSWDAVRDAARRGFSIGLHGVTHRAFAHLTPADVAEELVVGRQRIIKEVGVAPVDFAFPFGRPGDYRPADVDAVRRAGFRRAYTMRWGRFSGKGFIAPRIPIELSDSPFTAIEKVRGEWDGAVAVQHARAWFR